MARLWILSALLVAGVASGSGCVSPNVREVPHVTRALVSERTAGIAVAAMRLDGEMLELRIARIQERTWAETRSVERIAEFHYQSLAYAVWHSAEGPVERILLTPFALAGGILDLGAWALSAPFAYPSCMFGAIDSPPTTRHVIERDPEPLGAGLVVTLRPEPDLAAPPTRTVTRANGVVRVDLDAFATAAISAGRTIATLELALADESVSLTIPLALNQLLDVVAVGAERDRELREYRWRRLHQACPEGARGVRAAILERLGGGD